MHWLELERSSAKSADKGSVDFNWQRIGGVSSIDGSYCGGGLPTPTDWLVVCGEHGGGDSRIMADVCQRIVNSGHFAGADFSLPDRYIQSNVTDGTNPGNAQIWRQINTSHHIT
ncbi:beta family protein [Cupriavidus sp. PET2-C1]